MRFLIYDSQPIQEVRKIKKELKTMKVLSLVFILSFIFIFYILVDTYHVNRLFLKKQLQVDTTQLNEEEKQIVENIFSEIKPIYLENQLEFIFTKDIASDYHRETLFDDGKGNRILGFNKKSGKIYVLYHKNEYELRRTICHELLHTFIIGTNEEAMVTDIEPYMVCYTLAGGGKDGK